MESTQRLFCNIPVGIINNIISMVELVGEVTYVRYSEPVYDEYIWTASLNPNLEYADVAIDYNIDSNLTYAFGMFLDKYVTKLADSIDMLERCGDMEYVECE